jgi:hypothetical protein
VGNEGRSCPAAISDILTKGDTFILVDDGLLYQNERLANYSVLTFLEKDGTYYGAPTDDATAIDVLERARASGACLIVFAWPAFWWLNYYDGLFEHLRSRYACVLSKSRLVVYDLKGQQWVPAGEGKNAVACRVGICQ